MSLVDVVRSKDLYDYIPDLVMQSDGTYRKKCDIHGGTNSTSFTVFPDTNTYRCWSCESSGDIITYTIERDGCDFDTALRTICEFYNIDISQDKSYVQQKSIAEHNEVVCKKYEAKLPIIMDYLKKRGFTEEMIRLYRFGWSTKAEALTIPLINKYGQIVSFSYRFFNKKPKYKHGKNNELWSKSTFWYNLINASRLLRKNKRIFLVEGHLDSISCQQSGEAAVAYLGIVPSKDQVLSLKKTLAHIDGVEVVLVPDLDGKAITHLPQVRQMFQKWYPEANLRVALMDKFEKPVKDMNDVLKEGLDISKVQTQHIDIFTCEYLMSTCGSKEREFTEATKFVQSVKVELVKVEIAEMLANRWSMRIEDVRKQLFVTATTEDELAGKFRSMSQCIDAYYEMLKHPGYTLGFPAIDASFGKLRKKKVFLIGAYSKVGKTDFLIEILLHSVLRLKLRCVVFSMEMEAEAFMQRIMCKLFGITKEKLEEVMLSNEGAERILEIQQKLEEYIYIVDENNLTLDDIRDHVLVANRKVFDVPVDRVFVDYFQYLKGATEYTGTADAAKAMKPFAKSLNVQLFMLSQFNRQGNPWDEPSIMSFKGGNDMEASFDYALLLYRPGGKPGLTDIEKKELKFLTRVKIISRDSLKYNELFDLKYNPDTTRLEEISQKIS